MGHGDRWDAVFGEAMDFPTTVLALAQGGEPVIGDADGPFGLWRQDGPFGLLAVCRRGTEANELMTAFPLPMAAAQVEATVESVEEDAEGCEAWARVDTAGGASLDLLAADYFRHPDAWRPGARLRLHIGAIAYRLRPATVMEIEVADGPLVEDARARDPSFAGPVVVSVRGAAMLFPQDDMDPGDHEFRAMVLERSEHPFSGGVALRLMLRLTGDGPEDPEALILPVMATPPALDGFAPAEGDDVEGFICLYAKLADEPWPINRTPAG